MIATQHPLAAFKFCLLYSSLWLPSSFAFYTAAFAAFKLCLLYSSLWLPSSFAFNTAAFGCLQASLAKKQQPFAAFKLCVMSWSQHERCIATILRHFAPNLIIFEPLVSALYHIFSKTNTWGIISIPISIRSNQNILFVFLCLGHSVSDALPPSFFSLSAPAFRFCPFCPCRRPGQAGGGA